VPRYALKIAGSVDSLRDGGELELGQDQVCPEPGDRLMIYDSKFVFADFQVLGRSGRRVQLAPAARREINRRRVPATA
jgi:hypothetical protein